MIPALVDSGHRVTVFANSKENRTFNTENGVRVHHFRLPSAHWYASQVPGLRSLITLPLRQLEWSTAFYRRVAEIIKREKIDVLEATESGALFLSRLAPLVIRLHGSEFAFRKHTKMSLDLSVRWNDLLEANACKRALAITAPSRFQANEVIARRGWPTDRVRVIHNPVSTTMLEAGLKSEWTHSSEPIVLYTGRLAPVKGIETLMAAAKLVRQQNTRATFLLAGPWQMPQPPEAYGLELNLKSEDGVQWVGSKDEKELIDLYRSASLFVMPSHFESFGISVVEAMTFGLPVICTNAGALPELVEEGVTGRLVPRADSHSLAQAMLSSLENAGEQSKMGEAARSQVLSRFTIEHALAATLRVYSGVMGMADTRLPDLEGAISSGGRIQ